MYKLNLRVDDMVSLLGVGPTTVYNYRTMDDIDLPTKVKDKIFDILDVSGFEDARTVLGNMTDDHHEAITRKLSTVLTSKSILNSRTESIKESNFEKKVNVFSDLGSKVYVDALVHEINNVVKAKDDYEFIAYIKKYK